MFYVLAQPDGDDYPSVFKIFNSEEKAIAEAKKHIFSLDSSRQTIVYTYYFDQADKMFISDPYWLGRCEEGKDITYYRAFTNDISNNQKFEGLQDYEILYRPLP